MDVASEMDVQFHQAISAMPGQRVRPLRSTCNSALDQSRDYLLLRRLAASALPGIAKLAAKSHTVTEIRTDKKLQRLLPGRICKRSATAVPYIMKSSNKKSPGAQNIHFNQIQASETVTAPSPFMSQAICHRIFQAKSAAALSSCSANDSIAIGCPSQTLKYVQPSSRGYFNARLGPWRDARLESEMRTISKYRPPGKNCDGSLHQAMRMGVAGAHFAGCPP
jgi:hypothetical protein